MPCNTDPSAIRSTSRLFSYSNNITELQCSINNRKYQNIITNLHYDFFPPVLNFFISQVIGFFSTDCTGMSVLVPGASPSYTDMDACRCVFLSYFSHFSTHSCCTFFFFFLFFF